MNIWMILKNPFPISNHDVIRHIKNIFFKIYFLKLLFKNVLIKKIICFENLKIP